MSKVALFIKTKAKGGKRDELRQLWEKHLKPGAAQNPQQEVHVFCLDSTDDDTLFLFEVYSSQEALEAASQNPAFSKYMEEAIAYLAGPPEVAMTLPLWSKGG